MQDQIGVCMKHDNIYLKLFTSTLYISAFTFGGGFVIVPLLKKKFVDDLKWIEEKEMIDMTAIAQSSPGPIAVNTSILIGYQIAGFIGALVTVLGTILPPLIIISTISLFYTAFRDNVVINALLKGMQAGVAAVIIDVILNMGNTVVKTKQILPILTMIVAFIATYLHVNVIYIILTCGIIGAFSTIYHKKRNKEKL